MEKISEDVIDKIIDCFDINCVVTFNATKSIIDVHECRKAIKENVRQKGYIKQSREDEIREEFKRCKLIEKNNNDPCYKYFYNIAMELIDILDERQKTTTKD